MVFPSLCPLAVDSAPDRLYLTWNGSFRGVSIRLGRCKKNGHGSQGQGQKHYRQGSGVQHQDSSYTI